MKLTRRQLKRFILSEIKNLNEKEKPKSKKQPRSVAPKARNTLLKLGKELEDTDIKSDIRNAIAIENAAEIEKILRSQGVAAAVEFYKEKALDYPEYSDTVRKSKPRLTTDIEGVGP